jgi:hypothetical protein
MFGIWIIVRLFIILYLLQEFDGHLTYFIAKQDTIYSTIQKLYVKESSLRNSLQNITICRKPE